MATTYREWFFDGNGRRYERGFNRDEFLRQYLGKGFVDDLHRGIKKSIIWQCYRTGNPNGWLPITLEDIKKDFGVEPKYYGKTFYYVTAVRSQDGSRIDAYDINPEYAGLIFFDHSQKKFLYLRHDGKLFPEEKCIESEQEARDRLKKKLKDEEGKVTIITFPK